MAKVVNLNHVDTAVEGVATLALPISVLNYHEDFAVKSEVGSTLVLTNNTSPIDRPETIRYAVADVANVYKNTGVDPGYTLESKRGISLLAQLRAFYTVTDAAVPGYEKVLPVKAHLVLEIPCDAVITTDMALAIIGRLASTVLDTGVLTSSRLAKMLRGSLRPSDLS